MQSSKLIIRVANKWVLTSIDRLPSIKGEILMVYVSGEYSGSVTVCGRGFAARHLCYPDGKVCDTTLEAIEFIAKKEGQYQDSGFGRVLEVAA